MRDGGTPKSLHGESCSGRDRGVGDRKRGGDPVWESETTFVGESVWIVGVFVLAVVMMVGEEIKVKMVEVHFVTVKVEEVMEVG